LNNVSYLYSTTETAFFLGEYMNEEKTNFTIRIENEILQFARRLAEVESRETGEKISVNRVFRRWIRFAYKSETSPFYGNQKKVEVKETKLD